MAHVQYQTVVGWDPDLRDLGFTDTDTIGSTFSGLVESAVKITSGAPVATAGKFIPGAIIQNAVDGTAYLNSGTTASPVFSLIDTSTGGLPALTDGEVWVGNGSNVATGVTLSGDATISNTGVVTVSGSSSLTFSVTGNMEIAGAVTVSGGTLAGLFYPVGVNPQALSGPGALNTTAYQTQWTSTGTGDALTLADVTHIGHVKKISYVAEAAGGDTGVITPASVVGFSTVTLNAIGDYVVLAWAGSGWAILEYYGATVA
ncbi:MAG: hypothetical protein ACP5N7_01970 [Candidatus Pacearchaeota archaeon]